MDVPEGHPSGVDVRAFLQEVEPRIHDKLEEEILALNGTKFQLALKIQLCCATGRMPFSRLAKSMRI